jgi:predicted Zn-dependent peptidase
MFTSLGGFEFSFIQRPDADVVALQLAIPMDWTLQAGNNPYVPLIAADAITTGGAEGYSADEVLETMQDLNAQAFMYTQMNTLRGGINVAPENIDAVVTLANAILRSPSFDQVWFDRAKENWITRVKESIAIPAQQGYHALRLAIAGDSTYTAALTPSDPVAIAQVTVDMVREWHRQTIDFGSAVIAIAGPITADEAGLMVDNLLADLPRTAREHIQPSLPAYNPRQILLHVPNAEKTTLTLIAPIPFSGDQNDVIDQVSALALGADDQSILFQKIRADLRASYGLHVGVEKFVHKTRAFLVTGEVDTAQTAAARDLILQVFADLRSTALDQAVVDRYKSYIANGLPDLHNNTTQLATSMVDAVLDGGDRFAVTKIQALLDLVTPETMRARWSADFPSPDRVTVVAVSPDKAALPGACVITQPEEALSCP